VLAIGLVVTLYLFWQGARHNYQSIPINPDFRTLWSSNKVQEIKIDGDDIYGQLKPTEWITIPAGGRTQFFQVSYPTGTFTGGGGTALKDLVDSGGDAKIEAVHTSDLLMNILLPLVPWLLICVFIWLFIFRQFRNSAGAGGMLGSFGKSKRRPSVRCPHSHVGLCPGRRSLDQIRRQRSLVGRNRKPPARHSTSKRPRALAIPRLSALFSGGICAANSASATRGFRRITGRN
jgi:hypothetical protein